MTQDFFISYATPDVKRARELAAELRGRGASVYMDRDNLRAGDRWQPQLEKAVSESASILVLLSQHTNDAFWQREEVLHAIDLARREPDLHRLCPVYLSDASERERIPLGLRQWHPLYLHEEGTLARIAERLIDKAPDPPEEGSDGDSLKAKVVRLEKLVLERERHALTKGKHAEVIVLQAEIRRRVVFEAGELVAGARLLREVGNGNFGTIWLARRQDDGGEVAVKAFDLRKLTEGVMLWRFRRSIEAIQHLNSRWDAPSNIVRIHNVCDHELAFSMDYLSEGNLERIAQLDWSPAQKVDAFLDLCRAVDFAHDNGVIHRDIKPANIVLDAAGRPVLTDFDIADIRFATRLSVAIGGLGTPVFAAPEQLEKASQATTRSDVYSLGRLLHFLLLGRSPGLLPRQDDPELAELSRHPVALVDVLRKATRFNPADRFADVKELILAAKSYESRRARLRAYGAMASRWLRRRAWPLLFMTLFITALVAGLVWQARVVRLERTLRERVERAATLMASLHARFSDLQEQRDSLREEKERLDGRLRAVELALKDPYLRPTERVLKEQERRHIKSRLLAIGETQRRLAAEIEAAAREIREAQKRLIAAQPTSPPPSAGEAASMSPRPTLTGSSTAAAGAVGYQQRLALPPLPASNMHWKVEGGAMPPGLALVSDAITGVPRRTGVFRLALATVGNVELAQQHSVTLTIDNSSCGAIDLARCGDQCVRINEAPFHDGECFRVAAGLSGGVIEEPAISAPPWLLSASTPHRLYRLEYSWNASHEGLRVMVHDDSSGWSVGAQGTVGKVEEVSSALLEGRHAFVVSELAVACLGRVLAVDYNTERRSGYERLTTGDGWVRVPRKDWSINVPTTPSAADLGLDAIVPSLLAQWKAICAAGRG